MLEVLKLENVTNYLTGSKVGFVSNSHRTHRIFYKTYTNLSPAE